MHVCVVIAEPAMDWEPEDEPKVPDDNPMPSPNLADMPYDSDIGELVVHEPCCVIFYACER